MAILAVAVLNLVFVAPLRRADLRPGKVLSCCRNEMVQQDQDRTRIHRKNKSEVPGFGTAWMPFGCRAGTLGRFGVAPWFHASAGRRAIQMCLCRKAGGVSQSK